MSAVSDYIDRGYMASEKDIEAYSIAARMFAKNRWTVADFGCGVGHSLRIFESFGFCGTWIGIDRDKECVDWMLDQFSGKRRVSIVHGELIDYAASWSADLSMVIDIGIKFEDMMCIFEVTRKFIIATGIGDVVYAPDGWQLMPIEMESDTLWIFRKT